MLLFSLTALTMLAFAANSLLNRAALSDGMMDATNFGIIRLASGALALSVILLATGRPVWPRGLPKWESLALFAYIFGFSYAYIRLDAGLGALVLFATVQLTMFAGAVLGGEAVPQRRWLGAVLSLCGLVYLFWPVGRAAPPMGAGVSMMVAGVGWGVFSLLGRRAKQPLLLTAHSFIAATGLAFATLLFQGADSGALTLQGVLLAALSGAVTSGLGYALWYRILPELGASRAAVAQLTVPIIAVFAGALLLGEAMTLSLWLAAALVLGGVALALSAR